MKKLTKTIVDNIPCRAGVYCFYDIYRQMIYVGMSKNLRQRLIQHIQEEDNDLLINNISGFEYCITQNEEDAATFEGTIYDTFVDEFGYPPMANKIAPPRSKQRIANILKLISKGRKN